MKKILTWIFTVLLIIMSGCTNKYTDNPVAPEEPKSTDGFVKFDVSPKNTTVQIFKLNNSDTSTVKVGETVKLEADFYGCFATHSGYKSLAKIFGVNSGLNQVVDINLEAIQVLPPLPKLTLTTKQDTINKSDGGLWVQQTYENVQLITNNLAGNVTGLDSFWVPLTQTGVVASTGYGYITLPAVISKMIYVRGTPTPLLPPNAPILNVPAPNAIDVPQQVTFKWYKVPGALTYDLYVKDAISDSMLYTSTSITGIAHTASVALPPDKQCLWFATASNGYGTSDLSEQRTFTTVAPTVALPVSASISVAPDTFYVGQSTTASWSSQNSDKNVISGYPGFGEVTTSGNQQITPTVAGTYTLKMECYQNNVVKKTVSAKFVVLNVPPSVVIGLPAFFRPSFGQTDVVQNVNIGWHPAVNSKFTRVQLRQVNTGELVFDITTSDTTYQHSTLLAPGTNYELRGYGINTPQNGNWTSYLPFKTTGTPNPNPTTKLVAPDSVDSGAQFDIGNITTNGVSSDLSDYGPMPLNGTIHTSITQDRFYILRTKGLPGTIPAYDSCWIRVRKIVPPEPTTLTFTITPSFICSTDSLLFQWTSTNADYVTIPLFGGKMANNGSRYYHPSGPGMVTATAQAWKNGVVAVEATQTAIVNDCTPPATLTLTVNPQEVCYGDLTNVSWVWGNLDSVTINIFGKVPLSGNRDYLPPQTSTPTMVVAQGWRNGAVVITDSKQITVIECAPHGCVMYINKSVTKSLSKTSGIQCAYDTLKYRLEFGDIGDCSCSAQIVDTTSSKVTYVSETHSSNVNFVQNKNGVLSWNANIAPSQAGWIEFKVAVPKGSNITVKNRAQIKATEAPEWVQSNEVTTQIP